jgi:ribose 5-phosphate isomerase
LDIGQAIAKAAKQMVFIIEESKFVGQLKDAVPVLIEQVCLSPCNCSHQWCA